MKSFLNFATVFLFLTKNDQNLICHLMTFLFDNRFVDYKPTSLEKNYKHEMLTEVDLGVNIDLIDPDTYAVDQNGEA